MTRPRTPSPQTLSVLTALASAPAQWRYGYELARQLGLRSGSLYPILMRLADRDLLESGWEAGPAGKPARHLYRITAAGLDEVSRVPVEERQPRPGVSRHRLQGA